jgi:uncharacterized protein (TIGR02246 family)
VFERFTEKARRIIFFARYEACQYGSPFIETEHLLLGLLREDGLLVLRFLQPKTTAIEFRTQIEAQTARRESISTSIEVPLTDESKEVLIRAKEEADRLRHRHIGTEHLLLGILGIPNSLAARLLVERGADVHAIRVQIAEKSGSGEPNEADGASQELEEAIAIADSFLAAIKAPNWGGMASFFATNSQIVDWAGKRLVGYDEIQKQFEALFAPYSKRSVTSQLESAEIGPAETVVVSILWENVTIGSQSFRSLHRMTLVLARQDEEWAIYLLQVTPVVVS